MDPIRIDDPRDSRVAAYLDIRERDLAGRQGRFVAEGKVVLDLLLSSGRFGAESVLVLENRLGGLEDILHKAPADLPVYVVTSAVMDAIAGFHMHRGILAIGRKATPQAPEPLLDALPDQALVLVLVGIANHDNMGSIFRNAAAFGADAVLMDTTCCDPLYRKAIRVSVGAALKIPFASFTDTSGFTAMLAERGFEQLALSPRGRTDIRDAKPAERLALYLGTEGEGLPERLLARLQTVRITMSKGFDSLNVAAASAIALHHFSHR
ncbi:MULTISPECIES: TrmH family RNA methyltransferase [Mesorhizobium]|uniref:RNA methyltransferase n=2 Tax=Mesorhizobium TaxID=68287 RepID=A0A1A5IN97_RHILI|nr:MULTISPECIES: RNA methyltransferase [Mesorhizobium]MBE1706472.1 RNA methyltransferase [Mesorhizobium japonicum]MBE1715017.1 RNA methyltransferase [Mesorhizobium japonicum]MUT21603.1 RNA methyltransferase [Mesorhizobium japonicum]MUT27454.1 RNA methyltransferase [Mesorhizobium japonicum]OBP74098.1 RNA methyltransferase [Mesorhizobium loti]